MGSAARGESVGCWSPNVCFALFYTSSHSFSPNNSTEGDGEDRAGGQPAQTADPKSQIKGKISSTGREV